MYLKTNNLNIFDYIPLKTKVFINKILKYYKQILIVFLLLSSSFLPFQTCNNNILFKNLYDVIINSLYYEEENGEALQNLNFVDHLSKILFNT